MTTPPLKRIHQRGLSGILILTLPLAACAAPDMPTKDKATLENNFSQGRKNMLDEIYNSGKPIRFEQINVSDIVLSQFPAGSTRESVESYFNEITSTRVIESTEDTLSVRDNRGQAMLDPDARSIIITFYFDHDSKLRSAQAIHIKNQ